MSRPANSRPGSRHTQHNAAKTSTSSAATTRAAPEPSYSPEPQEHSLPPMPNLTPTQMKLLEKQQEHASLQALKEASGHLLERVEELAKMGNVMADGGEAVGSVMRNWPHVFSILNLFDHPVTPNQRSKADITSSSASSDPEFPPQADERAREEQMERDYKPLPQLVRLAFGGDEK